MLGPPTTPTPTLVFLYLEGPYRRSCICFSWTYNLFLSQSTHYNILPLAPAAWLAWLTPKTRSRSRDPLRTLPSQYLFWTLENYYPTWHVTFSRRWLSGYLSTGIWCHVVWYTCTDVSEYLSTCTIWVVTVAAESSETPVAFDPFTLCETQEFNDLL